jgi:hypothetical protein
MAHAPRRCGEPHHIFEKTPSFTVISENVAPHFEKFLRFSQVLQQACWARARRGAYNIRQAIPIKAGWPITAGPQETSSCTTF